MADSIEEGEHRRMESRRVASSSAVKGLIAAVGVDAGAAELALAGSDICRFFNELGLKNVKSFLGIV